MSKKKTIAPAPVEGMQAHVIRHRDGAKHVHIGTSHGALLKMRELVKAEFDSWPEDLQRQATETARRHGGGKSALEFYRTNDNWRIEVAPDFTIEIKP